MLSNRPGGMACILFDREFGLLICCQYQSNGGVSFFTVELSNNGLCPSFLDVQFNRNACHSTSAQEWFTPYSNPKSTKLFLPSWQRTMPKWLEGRPKPFNFRGIPQLFEHISASWDRFPEADDWGFRLR